MRLMGPIGPIRLIGLIGLIRRIGRGGRHRLLMTDEAEIIDCPRCLLKIDS